MFGFKKKHPHRPQTDGQYQHMGGHGPRMHEQPQPMNRSVSKWYVILSVLYVLVGIVMLVWKNTTVSMIGILIGVGMLAAGLTRVLIYFTRNHYLGIMEMDLTMGVTFSAFGLFMLLHKETVEMMLPFAVAIMLLIGAISKLQYALDLKHLDFKWWKVFLGCTMLILLLGVVLVCNPFRDQVLIWYMGISLVIEGILNIFAVMIISNKLKKMKDSSFVVSDMSAKETLNQLKRNGANGQIASQSATPKLPEHGDIE